jgi:hypothetical protein
VESSAAPVSGPGTASGSGGFRDGPLLFAVDGVECGVEQLGLGFLARRPNGQFCLVTMTVRNTGGSARVLEDSYQYAYDSTGARHAADYLSRLYLPGETIWNPVGAGGSVQGRLVFDIPRGSALARLELHEGPTGVGVSILF